MIASDIFTSQPRDAFRVRDMQRAKLEAMCLAEPEEPAVVERVEVRRSWTRVRKTVQRLWPRHQREQFPLVRTFREDSDGNGVFDVALTIRAFHMGDHVVAAVTRIELLADDAHPVDREIDDVPVVVIERCKLLTIDGG